ncbi:hypothetical protein SAMN04488101_115117 [Pedobacter nyackensis]|uniref:Uncharacterized protein n=1 Tax=Pedobacter nyackensis TaxID=475255 RepID=A0A1W2ETB1_9SPHI|nr:hypothetical protein SAMN04488101_115117 [Pedobacter nyackensis]
MALFRNDLWFNVCAMKGFCCCSGKLWMVSLLRKIPDLGIFKGGLSFFISIGPFLNTLYYQLFV